MRSLARSQNVNHHIPLLACSNVHLSLILSLHCLKAGSLSLVKDDIQSQCVDEFSGLSGLEVTSICSRLLDHYHAARTNSICKSSIESPSFSALFTSGIREYHSGNIRSEYC